MLAAMHELKFSHHQAQAVLNAAAMRGFAMAQQAGPDGLSFEQLGGFVAFTKGLGMPL